MSGRNGRFRSARKKAIQLLMLGCLISALGVVLPVRLPARPLAKRVPHTTGKEIALRLRDLAPRGQAKKLEAFSDGTVRAQRKMTLRPTVACPDMPFTAMAVVWDQHGGGSVSASVAVGQDEASFGTPSEVTDEPDGPDPGSREDHPDRRQSSLLWVGSARCSRLTVTLPASASVGNLRAVFVNSAGTSAADAETTSVVSRPSFGFGATAAEAATTEPAIITRKEWGADEKLRNCGPYYSGPGVKMAFVHHTAGTNDYSRSQSDDLIRAIYWYHTQVLGWCDIAYNFLVDRFGRIYEGRYGGMDQPVLPGATKGFNTGSVAVSAMGTFTTATPPAAMVTSIENLLAWRLDVAHVPPIGKVWMYSRGSTGGKYPEGQWVHFNRISGHRDAGYTSCPGDKLYAKLGAIRTVAWDTGLPKLFLPKQSVDALTFGQSQVVTWTATSSATMVFHMQVMDSNGLVLWEGKKWGASLSFTWDGVDGSGQPLSVGSYTVRIWGTKKGKVTLPADLSLAVVPEPLPSPSPSPSPTESPIPSPTP